MGGNKRFMRRDFKDKKDNVWQPGKARNQVKPNAGFVTEGDKNNLDFNEYYQMQGAILGEGATSGPFVRALTVLVACCRLQSTLHVTQ